jgi:hypothetical protein
MDVMLSRLARGSIFNLERSSGSGFGTGSW